MENIGLSQRFVNESTLYKGLYTGRIVSQYKNHTRLSLKMVS